MSDPRASLPPSLPRPSMPAEGNTPRPSTPPLELPQGDSADVTKCDKRLRFENERRDGGPTRPDYEDTIINWTNAALGGPFSPLADGLISDAQRKAILLLVTGESYGRAAEAVGVSRMTLWRWLQLDHFRKALEMARELAIGETIDRVRGLGPRAAEVLAHHLETADQMAAVRILRMIRVDHYPNR